MGERTKDLFEKIEGYRQAQLPNAEFFDYDLELSKMSFLEGLIHKLHFTLSGFKSFNRALPEKFEYLARRTDSRSGALFAPAISFSASFVDDDKKISPFERAAKIISGTIELKDAIFSAELSPDMHKGQMLEMGQYPNLFATSQIIESKKAKIYKATIKNQITVICNGCFYILDLKNIDVKFESGFLVSVLKNIAEDSRKNIGNNYLSPGIITASENPVQVRIVHNLRKKDINKKSFEIIKQSLFTLCLDLDSNPSTYEEVVRTTHSSNLHNRWFHSSLQLIVFNNSKAGININFSLFISGNNMMRAAYEIAKRSKEFQIDKAAESENKKLYNLQRLNWEVEKKQIDLAQNSFNKIKDKFNSKSSYSLSKIGRKSFGSYEIHAVPIFILALQLTVRKILNRDTRITQFLSMSKYRCMDLLRSNVSTEESKAFVSCMNKNSIDKKTALKNLDSAIYSQIKVNREMRSHLPIHEQLRYYIASLTGIFKFYNVSLILIKLLFLGILGYLKAVRTEIIVSHPNIYPEVPVIGRSGIRIPYAKYFGLHYQIMDYKINITMMPGLKWKIPNRDFAVQLEDQLLKIKSIITN